MKNNRFIKGLKRILALVLMMSMMTGVMACGKKSSGRSIVPGSSITPAPSKSVTELPTTNGNEIIFTGIITYLNSSELKMHFVDVASGTEYEVKYTGATDIKSKYGKIKAAATMTLGEIYDVTCDKTGKAKKIYGSESAWERTGVTGVTFDEETRKISLGATDLAYESYSVVLSEADRINIAEIVAQDEVTLRGIDNKVYSINVDNGHGYVSLTGVDSFINGYVTVGKKLLLEVTKNMLITAPVGTYTVELQKGSLIGSKTINVVKGQQTTVDFTEYTTSTPKFGSVKFMVTPANAIMSIDGTEVDYSEPISLSYGTHRIILQANYYETYTELITVNSAYTTKVMDMTATSSKTTSGTGTTTATTKASNATTAGTTADLTAGHSVNVTQPVGATLYVDSVYIGTIPCSFDKSAGNKTVTLSQNGFSTVSYTISISNTATDATYSFPDMVAK